MEFFLPLGQFELLTFTHCYNGIDDYAQLLSIKG